MDSDAVANSIREDPRTPGLLYAATETQVWVSFDDGNHWESLRINMPAISVRDIQLKDDSTCLCADLVAATHGRGFWILDDVTPLRQLAAARAGSPAYLFKPQTAVRVRFGTNDPTPWPPEWPAGENPPPGGIIDYMLSQPASRPVTLEILDGAGTVVRSYASTDSVLTPDPAIEPDAYNHVCQEESRSPDCSVPLYWAAPQQRLSTAAGMHRFTWDLHYDPVGPRGPADDNGAAVPHHTYPAVNSPWAPPGTYTVRLTVDGKKYTQPLTLRLDPRVRTPALGLARLASLSKEMYEGAVATQGAYDRARALAAALGAAGGDDARALKTRVDSLAPPPAGRGGGGGRGGFRRGGGAEGPVTLQSANGDLIGAALGMQGADIAPSAGEVAACTKAREERATVLRRWAALSGPGLAAFNAKRKAAGQPEVRLP
jgi:hypothetical protein